MVEIKYNIFEIDPDNLLRLDIISDKNLKSYLEETSIPGTFVPNEDFIALSFYTLDDTRLSTVNNHTKYSVLSGDSKTSIPGNAELSIDPLQDYKQYYNDNSEVKSLYHFLRNPFRVQDTNSNFSIESISPDRKEIRLVPVSLQATQVAQLANKLEERLNNSTFNLDLHLYDSENNFYPLINIGYRNFRGTTALVVKLSEPLPQKIKVYSLFSIVEKISNSIAFEINTTILEETQSIPTLRGANFNTGVEEQSTEPTEYFNYNELFSFPTNNSNRELNSLFNEKGAELGIDYSEFNNFINFSSIEERLRNFKYKVDLLNSYQGSLDIINTTGTSYTNTGITGSRAYYENLLDGVVNNFDHYERNLYYESGSNSWPKGNSAKPYVNLIGTDTEATTWYTGKLQQAILYDAQNPNILTNTIPSYLKEDSSNEPYNLFIDMIGQHFDNLWVYTDAVSKKYDADNRLNRGVSKDLVEELLKNFGVKLYTSNKSAEDLFRYFIVNSYDAPDEYLPGGIVTSGEQPLSQNDYQKEIHKRIYHNLPIILKSKGTERGLRALINCFGIPSDILKIKIYGGQSTTNLPFYGGEQAWTGSIDKVRLDNTGSLVEGSTLSYYTGITRGDSKYTQDLHRIEVGFSPSDNMDSYIVSQSAVLFPNDAFNIDDYIGDPRGYTSNIYPDLVKYSKIVFENADSYNLKDFVRLIKFFDNVVFRMVKDFVPARAVADTGIIIKPHLLERYHAKSPVMTWTRPEYSGSIDTAFISGSNAGAYKNSGAGSVGTRFNRESSTKQAFLDQTPLGKTLSFEKTHEEPKFNGELNKAIIRVSNGELNEKNPFKNLKYSTVKYGVVIHKDPPDNVCILNTQPLEIYPLNPEANNNNNQNIASNFNLENLFGSTATAVIDYIVTQNNIITQVIGNNVYYNFIADGIQQYEEIIVEANHPTDDTCTNSRIVKIVKCDLYYISNVLPPTLVPDIVYSFSDAINTGENTEIEYLLNGEVINSTSHTIDYTDYNNGDTITLVVRDLNNPLGCVVTQNFTFSNCILSSNIMQHSVVGFPPRVNAPYTFLGTNQGTTFQFRIVWDSFSTLYNLGAFEADVFGQWMDIGSPVPAGTLTDVVEQTAYPAANIIQSNLGSSATQNLSTFTEIETFIQTNIYLTHHAFRLEFKATAATGESSCTLISDNLYVLDNTTLPGDTSTYHEVDAFYEQNTYGNYGSPNACCANNSTTLYLDGYQSLVSLFDDPGTNNSPQALPYGVAPSQGDDGDLAPSGWYYDGMSKYCHWFNMSNEYGGYWGNIQQCTAYNSSQCFP